MVSHPHQPKQNDAVLGTGQLQLPSNAAVLGGLAGVRRRLHSALVSQRVAAVKESVNYGKAGISVVLEALKDDHYQVRYTAYSQLQGIDHPQLPQLLSEYNPYQCLKCLYRHSTAHSTAYALAISPDQQLLISGATDKIIKVRSLHTGKILCTLKGHRGSVSAVTFHPHQPMLISGSWDSTIKLWDLAGVCQQNQLASDRLMATFRGTDSKIYTIALHPEGKILASGNQDGTITLWDIQAGEKIGAIAEHTEAITDLAFTPNGKTLISSSMDNNTLNGWNWQAQHLQYSLTGHSNWVSAIAISPDGEILASGSQDKTIKLWHLPTGEVLNTLTGHWGEIKGLAISQDGQTLVSCSWDEIIRFWHLPTGLLLHTLTGHRGAIVSLAINSNVQIVVSSSQDRTIRIWGMD
ncbi:MAG: WD40 repeat domain-containing protein [Coleofasciculus sp. G1-WW12-02]|uniref:WD40 repeat domain-containing protein n=1 Tax=Coleofasciculus sp. G1-WW12-02 TaxID=3068483 RepID=UPI0033037199